MKRIELQVTRSGIKLTLNEYQLARRVIAVGDGFDLPLQVFQRQPRPGDDGAHRWRPNLPGAALSSLHLTASAWTDPITC